MSTATEGNAMTAKPLDLAQFEGHTPGPWISPGLDDQDRVIAKMIAGKMRTLAHVYRHDHYGVRIAEQEINAALIAAAPALLSECKRQREQIAALREALEMFGWYTRQPEYNGALPVFLRDFRDKARAALKVSE